MRTASLVVILVRCTIVMVAAGKGLFKAIAPDEAADPQRHRILDRLARPACERQHDVDVGARGQTAGELACLGHAAEYQNAVFGHVF